MSNFVDMLSAILKSNICNARGEYSGLKVEQKTINKHYHPRIIRVLDKSVLGKRVFHCVVLIFYRDCIPCKSSFSSLTRLWMKSKC